jgi:hypothetical protein
MVGRVKPEPLDRAREPEVDRAQELRRRCGTGGARDVVAPGALGKASVALQRRLHHLDHRRAGGIAVEDAEQAVAHAWRVGVLVLLGRLRGRDAHEPGGEGGRQARCRGGRTLVIEREERGGDVLAVETHRALADVLD